MKILPKSKLSQSEVISTILLILIVIGSTAIIISFVVPFVKERLSSSQCLDVANQIEIVESQYTCYDKTDNPGKIFLQVHVGKNDSIKGFTISLGGASSSNYNVIPGEFDNVYPYAEGQIEIPGENEERTYIIYSVATKPDSISVYPILEKGQTCDGDTINTLEDCTF